MGWLFSRRRRYDELSDCIREHPEEKVADLMDRGMTRKEAERAARCEFGNVARIEERSREVWQWPKLENTIADIRFALRVLRKSPAFTIVSALTLTLAIGVNVVVFGVLNALVLHPLPVPEGDRIYQVQTKQPGAISISYPNYVDIRDRNSTFSELGVVRLARIGIGVHGIAQPVWGYEVSGNYFPMLRTKPLLVS